MFTRKLTVLAVPLALMLTVCLLVPVLSGLGPFFGSVVLGALLGVALALLLRKRKLL